MKCEPCDDWGLKSSTKERLIQNERIKAYVKEHGRQPFESKSGECADIKLWEK